MDHGRRIVQRRAEQKRRQVLRDPENSKEDAPHNEQQALSVPQQPALDVVAADHGAAPIVSLPPDGSRRVAYAVEPVRVGQRTDYDKLTLDIQTDGSIDAQAALREAAEILIAQLALFTDADRIQPRHTGPGDRLEHAPSDGTLSDPVESASVDAKHDILIEELELSMRSYNCLKRVRIQTIGDLVAKSERELNAIPNLGQKSIDEVIEALQSKLNLRES
jgi:DNA-directed RNA polymerase alpha subunit